MCMFLHIGMFLSNGRKLAKSHFHLGQTVMITKPNIWKSLCISSFLCAFFTVLVPASASPSFQRICPLQVFHRVHVDWSTAWSFPHQLCSRFTLPNVPHPSLVPCYLLQSKSKCLCFSGKIHVKISPMTADISPTHSLIIFRVRSHSHLTPSNLQTLSSS